jgi:hypothetical protein
MGAKLTRDIVIITPEGKKYLKKEGEFIWALQSARFTQDDMKQLAHQS